MLSILSLFACCFLFVFFPLLFAILITQILSYNAWIILWLDAFCILIRISIEQLLAFQALAFQEHPFSNTAVCYVPAFKVFSTLVFDFCKGVWFVKLEKMRLSNITFNKTVWQTVILSSSKLSRT